MFRTASDLIVDETINAVYIDNGQTDLECIELCRLALQNGKMCLVDSYRIFSCAYALARIDSSSPISSLAPIPSFSPRWSLVSEIIERNFIGVIGTIRYDFSQTKAELDKVVPSNCSPFEYIAAQSVYILDLLFPNLLHVQGIAIRSGQVSGSELPYENAVVFSFHTTSKAVGCATFNFNSSLSRDRLTIDGSNGTISLPIFSEDVPEIIIGGERVPIPESWSAPSEDVPTNEACFIRSLIGGSESGPLSNLVRGQKRVGKIVDIVLQTYYGDRHDYFWTRPDTWDV